MAEEENIDDTEKEQNLVEANDDTTSLPEELEAEEEFDSTPGEDPDFLAKNSGGRAPSLRNFINTLNRYGIRHTKTQTIARRLSYTQIAALRGHPDFSSFLDGLVLKAMFLGRKLTQEERWMINFLSRDTQRSVGRPNSVGIWGQTDPSDAVVIEEGAPQEKHIIRVQTQ